MYRRNRDILLSYSDLCALCGHHGAQSADHIIPARLWPRDANGKKLPGYDSLENLQPAHGTMGSVLVNRCPECGKLCNQAKGDRIQVVNPQPQSRNW